MICKNCGTQMPDNAKFCTNCGCVLEIAPTNDIQPTEKAAKNDRKPNTFLSILCCVLIFIFAFSTLVVFTARHSLDSDNIERFMYNVDVESIAGKLDLDDELLSDDPKVIKKLYNKTFIGDFVEDYIEDYAEYILGEERFEEINVGEVIENIQNERYHIEQIIRTPLKNEDIAYIYDTLDYEVEEGVLSRDVLAGSDVSLFRTFLSVYIAVLLALLTLLFIFLLLKSRRFNAGSMVWTAIPLLFASLIFAVVFTIKPIILSFLTSAEPVVTEIVSTFMSTILGIVLIYSLIIIAICILLIIIYNIIKKRRIKA